MVVVPKFTPELLVALPQRGPAVPNHDGTLALFSQSTHEVGGKTSTEYRVLHIGTGKTEQLIADEKARDVVWLGNGTNTVLYLSQREEGYTWIKTIDADTPAAEPSIVDFIEAPVKSLKVMALKNGSIAFVVAGLADVKGILYNKENDKKPHTARVTDNWNPRIWDSYPESQHSTLWYTSLVREDGDWKLNKPLKNVLRDTTLTAPPFMYEPGDRRKEFDISDRGIIFSATEQNVNHPRNARLTSIYHLPLSSFSDASTSGPLKICLQQDVHPQSTTGDGHCSQPRFSPNGTMIAFLRSSFEKPSEKSIWIKHVESCSAIDVCAMVTGKSWGLKPACFEFALDGHSVYIQAKDSGRVALFKLNLLPNACPQIIFRNGSVSAYHQFRPEDGSTTKLLVTSSSFVEPWICQIIDSCPMIESDPWIVSKTSKLNNIGLSPKQVSEIYFEGTADYFVHAWVIKPRDFDPSKKKYPLCLQVHGGPNDSWDDEWNAWWNLLVWAEQGYIVVAPNITGSDGFGLGMAEAIQDNWGGRPYDDLVNCLEHIKHMPGIDMDNAVAAGGSWGGYMMNWIQGQDLGRRFKALVCHDGIFHLPTFLLQTDALPQFYREFGGPPFIWSNFDGLERYNPARPDLLQNWKTPMLVVHSDKDYRCPITEGLAAFHTLKALGTPTRFLSFPDENHVVSREENVLEWNRQVFAWINEWSGIATRE
ncbi:hypothetical protein TruAng_000278 [Truncatella angustata]|nr:hypothetical protein TruAng_000278 [Truncatella angustata]